MSSNFSLSSVMDSENRSPSRCFFYLYSKGNPLIAIHDNHATYLHRLWQRDHFFVDVQPKNEGGSLQKKFSFYRLFWSVLTYPVGMLGYLIDTILKVVTFFGNLILWVVSLFSCNTKWLRNRSYILLDTAIALLIGVIGILFPPLAYRLDLAAKLKMQRCLSSHSQNILDAFEGITFENFVNQ